MFVAFILISLIVIITHPVGKRKVQNLVAEPVGLGGELMHAPMQQLPMDTTITMGVLENGLTYYIYPTRWNEKTADFYLIQKTGSLVEEDNELGIAHFLEHMLFQGTKHFPDQTIINFLNEIGVKFGDDLNAETNFSNTTYKIPGVPIPTEGRIDTCLQILRDWSADAIIEDSKIDKERSVVKSELRWRGSDNSMIGIIDEIYKGTRYEGHEPIGRENTLDKIDGKMIRDFYSKWYQPQNQAVVIIGDVDKNAVEKTIRKMFGDLKKGDTVVPNYGMTLAKHKEPNVLIRKNGKGENCIVELFYNNPLSQEKNYRSSLRRSIDIHLQNDMIEDVSQRLTRMQGANNEILGTSSFLTYWCNIEPDMPMILASTSSVADMETSLSLLSQEVERINRYGFSKGETNNPCNGDGNLNDSITEMKDFREGHVTSFNNISDHFLYGYSLPSAKTINNVNDYYERHMTNVARHSLFRSIAKDENLTIIVSYPDIEGAKYPSKEDILRIYRKARKADLSSTAFVHAVDQDFMRIAKQHKPKGRPTDLVNLAPIPYEGNTELTYANGVKVIYSEINGDTRVVAFRHGGLSQFDRRDRQMAIMAQNVLKDPFHNCPVSDTWTLGEVSYDDVFTLQEGYQDAVDQFFRFINFRLTSTTIDTLKFERKLNAMISSRKAGFVYEEDFSSFSNSNIRKSGDRFKPLNANELKSITIDDIQRVRNQMVDNFNGAVFVVRTKYSLNKVRPLLKKYFGSLPSKPTPCKFNARKEYELKEADSRTVRTVNGLVPVVSSNMYFVQAKNYEYTQQNIIYLNAIRSILNQLVTSDIRYQQGSLYSVQEEAISECLPETMQAIKVTMSCSEKDYDTLNQSVRNIMHDMAYGNLITDRLLASYKNSIQKKIDQNALEMFDFDKIRNFYYNGGRQYSAWDMSIINAITPAKLRKFLRTFMDNVVVTESVEITK